MELIRMISFCSWCSCQFYEDDSDAEKQHKYCCREHELEDLRFFYGDEEC